MPDPARIRIGGGTFLNLGVMIAALELVEIGEHCMFANGCFVTDASHRFDDPSVPVPWQGFTSKGPTRIGDNVWCGAHVVVTSGVTIGRRCVIGANSVVTKDIPPYSIAAGVPAKVIGRRSHTRGAPPEHAPGRHGPGVADGHARSAATTRSSLERPTWRRRPARLRRGEHARRVVSTRQLAHVPTMRSACRSISDRLMSQLAAQASEARFSAASVCRTLTIPPR